MIKFEPWGQWAEAVALGRGLSGDINHVRQDALREWGNRAVKIAKGHLDNQDLPWPALKARTVQNKKDNNRPYIDEILRETNQMYKTIKRWLPQRGYKNSSVYAGIPVGIPHKNAPGLTVGDIAVTHEYGVHELRIPARPLWQPTMMEMREETKDVMLLMLHDLQTRLQSKYKMPSQIY